MVLQTAPVAQLHPGLLSWRVWTVRNVNRRILGMASMPERFINCQSFGLALGACPLRTVNVLARV